jgi:hypothetical protein
MAFTNTRTGLSWQFPGTEQQKLAWPTVTRQVPLLSRFGSAVFVRAFLHFRKLRSVSIGAKTAARAAAERVTNHFRRQFEKSTANRKPFSSGTRQCHSFLTPFPVFVPTHHSRPRRLARSYLVRLLHSRLSSGLCRRTLTPVPASFFLPWNQKSSISVATIPLALRRPS